MKPSLRALVFTLLLLQGVLGYSQEKWFGEFRPGVNFPVSENGLKTGPGFGLNIGYNFMPHLGATVGWGWNKFKSDDNFFITGNKYDLEETGYSFGLQFIHPFSTNSNISYLIRLGGTYNHMEVENSGGDLVRDSKHGFGWEAGAGIDIDFGANWSLRPQIGYRSLTRKMEAEAFSTDFDLNYITLGFGIAKSF